MLFWSLVAHAAEPTVGGIVTPQLVMDLSPGDWRYEDSFEEHTWARGWAAGELPRGDRWFLEARVQSHLLLGKSPTGSGGSTEGWWEGSLGDSGWDGKIAGSVRAKVGVLTERWGRLDLLPISDVLNPRDQRSGPLTPGEFARIPIPMGVISFGTDTLRSETTLIPFSSADRMWLRDEDWSYVRQGMIEGELNEIKTSSDWSKPGEWDTALGTLQQAFPLPDSLRRGLDATANGRDLPEALLYNGEIAERLTLHTSRVDLALMGGYLRARQPDAALKPELRQILIDQALPTAVTDLQTIVLSDPVGPLVVDWPRTAVVGADAAALVGPVQIRAESMYQSEKPVRLWYGGSDSVPQLGSGLGLDYLRGSTFAVTLESRWLHLVDPPKELLLSTPDDVQIAGGVRVIGLRNQLTVQVGGAYDVSFSEYFFKPSVGWRFGDHLNAELGALLLGGSTPAPTSLTDSLTYTGGPASYFSQNDALTLSVSLIR